MSILNSSTLGSLNSTQDTASIGNSSAVSLTITGTWVGTISFQGSFNGTDFYSIPALSISSGLYVISSSANGAFLINISGYSILRLKMTSYTSGTSTCEVYTVSSNTFNSNITSIIGNTDGTKIGNSSDRLKVDASFTASPRVSPSYIGSKIKFDDMNVANGGIARDTSVSTSYTQLYSYTGNGHLFSFAISLEGALTGADPYDVKLEIDGVNCFEVNTNDIGTSTFWNLSTVGDEKSMGISLNSNTLRFSQKEGGLRYETGLKIYVKKGTGSKRFRGGMVYLTKE